MTMPATHNHELCALALQTSRVLYLSHMALTQDDLQAIGQVIDQKLDTRLKPMEQDIRTLKTGVSHIETAVDAIAEGQKDLRGKVVKELKNHERRITDLEDQAHSHKN